MEAKNKTLKNVYMTVCECKTVFDNKKNSHWHFIKHLEINMKEEKRNIITGTSKIDNIK